MCALALAALLGVALLSGCSAKPAEHAAARHRRDDGRTGRAAIPVKIGTLATEDSLPLWVAEKMGYFSTEGIPKVEIVQFQSAQERDVALASGAIDGFMGDIIAAANLSASGKGVKVATIMLGADQSQGRFGVVVPPKSTVTDIKELAGVPVGTSSATIQEYVLDGLMAEAGVAADQVKTEEVKKVPVRFELLMADKLKAAALPEPFLTLAEQGGAKLVGDDTKAADEPLADGAASSPTSTSPRRAGATTVDGVLERVGRRGQRHQQEPGRLPQAARREGAAAQAARDDLQGADVPHGACSRARPTSTRCSTWMKAKGYLKADVTYDQIVGLPKQ